eukprot:CAMPEP_0201601356 /NCGR_PEP_ID=MMETSP0492-20130828/2331_1 /ASSEMBLY_ACC=CAM_ASM_000837 /TAXON_ID=420259 /ORGANISM="Thalassiosira gravida, Strain GMp14c1" /LENGTH=76 /DNA_ID=CAMNT_0048064539 /DNA_START=37 /DNA_END=267 /DNA_ORIENTATION=-
MIMMKFTQLKEHEGANPFRYNKAQRRCRNQRYALPSVPPCNNCTKTSSSSPHNPHTAAPGYHTSNVFAFVFWSLIQ